MLRAKLTRAAPTITISDSLQRPLPLDLAWADVAVANVSTSVVEAVLAGVPVFVHVAAWLEGVPASSFVHPSRRFFLADDGVAKVTDLVRRARAGEDVSAADDFALETLFGPSRRPATLAAALARGPAPGVVPAAKAL
jgi:hypothetical protein